MRRVVSFIKRFYVYQKTRFPIIALILSFLPPILSSGAVILGSVSLFQIIPALVVSLLYLFHIRVGDEERDYAHDTLYHKDRPIQSGIITREELRRVDIICLFVIVNISIFSGLPSIMTAFVLLAYSYAAGKDFFMNKKIRKHFFLYNGLNILQMILLQFFIYTLLSSGISFHTIFVFHYIFTSLGTVIFEFLRKVKIPGQDGTGKDTYTWHLGFTNSIAIYVVLVFMNALVVFITLFLISGGFSVAGTISFALSSLSILSALLHKKRRDKKSDTFMRLVFAVSYSMNNLLIYYLIVY